MIRVKYETAPDPFELHLRQDWQRVEGCALRYPYPYYSALDASGKRDNNRAILAEYNTSAKVYRFYTFTRSPSVWKWHADKDGTELASYRTDQATGGAICKKLFRQKQLSINDYLELQLAAQHDLDGMYQSNLDRARSGLELQADKFEAAPIEREEIRPQPKAKPMRFVSVGLTLGQD